MSDNKIIWREGIAAGLIGATAVALWFGILDASQGNLLATPIMLGTSVGTLFLEGGTPGSAAAFLGYTVFHYTAFVVVGLVFAWVTNGAERVPSAFIGLLGLFVTFEVGWLCFTLVLAEGFGRLTWLQVFIANLIGSATMAVYMWRQHPALARRVDRQLAGAQE